MWTTIEYLDILSTEPPKALGYTTRLSITTRLSKNSDRDPDLEGNSDTSEDYPEIIEKIRKPRSVQADSLNRFVRSLIRNLPKNRLTSFE